ncbi:MAG: potassium/hydrogen antiporter [Frankiaceae bacterium]|jgi:cell volume regulation protein A|nr:potassium/hydrogen antiporter [Frankiaceae bacterium]
MGSTSIEWTLFVGSAVLLLAVVAARITTSAGLPTLLVYLVLGVALGQVPGFAADPKAAEALGVAAIVVILAEGGLTTRIDAVRPVLPIAATLSVAGTAVSVAVVAGAAHWLIHLDGRLALLAGAVLAPTDAAAVFAILRRVPLVGRLGAVLEAESGTNDPLAAMLVFAIVAADWDSRSAASLAVALAGQLVIGAAVGLAVGFVGAQGLRRTALPASGLYPLSVLAFCVLSFGAAALVHGSGFLAVYLTALWLGNARLPHRPATVGFAEGVGWLAQIGVFILLGMLVDPRLLAAAIVPALVLGGALLLVARPLSVAASCLPFRMPWREQLFLSWAGLRGAVPIVFAVTAVARGVPGAVKLFDAVFLVVFVLTAVQAPVLAPLARRLRLLDVDAAREVQVEVAPLEQLHADMLQLTIPPGSRMHGVEVEELRLPASARLSLVVRGGQSFVPQPGLRLRVGDSLLIVTPAAERRLVEQRLRAISRRGRLANWAD